MHDSPDPASLRAIIDRLERGDRKFDEMAQSNHAAAERMEAMAEAIAKISEAVAPIHEIRSDVEKMKGDVAETKEIVEAWSAVKTMGKFIKWAASIVGAAGIVLVAIKAAGVHLFRG